MGLISNKKDRLATVFLMISKKLKTEKFNQFKLELVAYITKNYKDIMIK